MQWPLLVDNGPANTIVHLGISVTRRRDERQIAGIIAIKPTGDKISRMAVASAKFEAGQVLLPERAAWLPDLEAELFSFPGSRHDDQCDSMSQALLDKNVSFMAFISVEEWERLIAKSKIPKRYSACGPR